MADNWKKGEDKLTSAAAFESRQRDHVHYQPIGVRAQRRQAAAARLHGPLKPMRFVSLHHHSTFSFMDGFQLPDAHVRRATEIQMGALAMTEHGNIFSHVKLEKAAEAAGVKPIFGCEFYCGWTDEARRTQRKNHLTVLAKNPEGYRNLLALVTRSWAEGFHYEPTVDWDWLVQHQKGLVVLSGCQGSALFTACVGGKHVSEDEAGYDRAMAVAKWFSSRLDDFYVEVQAFPELEKTCQANPMLARIAKAIKRPLVATMDCHYTAPEEQEVQQILHNCRPGEKKTLEQMVQDWGYDVPLCPPVTDKALYKRLRGTGLSKEEAVEAIVSTEEIAQGIDLELPKLPKVEFPLPTGVATATDLWRDWIKEGWRFRGCDKLPPAERDRYRAQLKKEMEVIEAKGYENYFLIVSDSIKFAKDQGVPVGPARGSAAASLACYLLRITEVNPMDYDNLVFERFIDWSREDMPDVDMDFATYGRPIVRDYMLEKYGEGCVNNIGTVTMYKSKLALDDVARVHQVPKKSVEKIKELLIERSSGDLRASATIEDTVDQFDTAYEVFKEHPELSYAMDLEGNAKGFGVHAAGLVVSTEPITNMCAILEREVPKGSGNVVQVVSMDKYDAERQGLEKLDYLALSTLDMISDAMDEIGMTVPELYALPFDDPEVIRGFKENDVVGIFQFDGRATRFVNGRLKPDDFAEIVNVNALSRPGPLHNGAALGYIEVKEGHKEPDRLHPALDLITAETKGQIIFQEQILRIVRDIGDFDWTHAAHIRKIISKKLGEQEFSRQWEKFRDGAATVHERFDVPPMDEATARRIWLMCITAGAYAFNAAHSTAYSMIAYWCMWFKRKHPAAFYSATLAKTDDASKLRDVLWDGVKAGLEVLPPSMDSDVSWRAEGEHAVRAGWSQITGVGPKAAEAIHHHVDVGGATEVSQLGEVKGIGPKTLDRITAFMNSPDPFGITLLHDNLDKVRRSLEEGIEDSRGNKLPTPTHSAQEIVEATGGETIVFLGQPLDRNLRDLFESNRSKGHELDMKKVKRPDLRQWVNMMARDEDEQGTFVCSRFRYPKFRDLLWSIDMDKDLVLIRGKKTGSKDDTSYKLGIVHIDSIWVLEP